MKKLYSVLLIASLVVLSSMVTYSAEAAGIPKKAISTTGQWTTDDLPHANSGLFLKGTGAGSSPAYSSIASGDLPSTVVRTDQSNTFGSYDQVFPSGNLKVKIGSYTYQITGTGIGANHTLYLPQIVGDDTLATLSLAQTFTQPQTFQNTAKINGISSSIVSKSGDYTLSSTDDTVLASAGSAFTLTLPSASSNTGKIYTIKKVDTSANKVTISGSIDSSSSVGISTPNRVVQLQSDGTVWRTIGGNNTVPYATMYNSTAATVRIPTAVAATPYKLAFDTEISKVGITHTADGHITTGGGGDITVLSSGVYHIRTEAHLYDANTAGYGMVWMKKNGVDIPTSVTRIQTPAVNPGSDTAVSDDIVQLNAGDTITVWWATSSTSIDLGAIAVAGVPTVPAATFQIFKIGG